MQRAAGDQVAVATYADRPVTKAPNWHGLVTLDILFNNLTTGLFVFAALAELVAPQSFGAVARLAYPLALLLLLADLVCLVLDLGDPLRFHHMLRVWKPSSPMSLGTWCLTAYSAPLTVLTALSLIPRAAIGPEWIRPALLIVGLVPALGAALYKGVLFSTTAQPGWKDARWLGGYFINSALMLGAAELLVLALLLGQVAAVAVLRPVLAVLLLLNVPVLVLLLADLRPTLSLTRSRRELSLIGALVIPGGLLLPLLLLALGGLVPLVGATVCILIGAIVLRSEIVRLPHRLRSVRPLSASSR